MSHPELLYYLAITLGFFMAWGVGANDVANAMGTSVGSRSLSIRNAIIIAAIFEAAGAILAGGGVAQTIRANIIDVRAFINMPHDLVYGMLSSLLAAGIWLLLATYLGWPVSTTHSIVGAIVGFGSVCVGVDAIHWSKIIDIVLSWIVTPMLSGLIAYAIFNSMQKLILNRRDPLKQAKRYVPLYVFFTAFVIVLITLTKGLKHLQIDLNIKQAVLWAVVSSVLIASVGKFFVERIKTQVNIGSHYASVEKAFAYMVVFTASAMAFAHGSNDTANAIGPLAAALQVIQQGTVLNTQVPLARWILLLGAFGIVCGLVMYGYRVIRTIGEHITELTPSRAFAAEIATACTIILATGTGLPVSTTQTLVGAVLGVGFARGIGALNLGVVRNIFLSWLVTLPMGAGLSIVFFYGFKYFL